MRLFTAINFDDNIKDALSAAISELKARGIRGTFTLRENLHLTLVFLGETPRVSDVKAAMDKLSFWPFEIEISGLGSFHSGILWCGIKQNPALSNIHARLNASLRQTGFKTDTRPFAPHLTICRETIFPPGTSADTYAALIPNLRQRVSHISLMKSERIDGKMKYTEIHRTKPK
jgi:2'-5' RNA ligase